MTYTILYCVEWDVKLYYSIQYSVCQSAYHQLRQLRPIIRSLSVDVATMLVQAFVSSRLDYCNCLLIGITDGLMRRLQAVQNATARLITGTRRRDHITPILRQLHWLPVRQRIQFKLAMLAFKTLHCSAHSSWSMTVSSSLPPVDVNFDRQTSIRVSFDAHLDDRSFAVAGPRLWNSLPVGLRHINLSIRQFRCVLKTHLFN